MEDKLTLCPPPPTFFGVAKLGLTGVVVPGVRGRKTRAQWELGLNRVGVAGVRSRKTRAQWGGGCGG